jgi:Zn-dependent M28 family amino/carboxypeptidase
MRLRISRAVLIAVLAVYFWPARSVAQDAAFVSDEDLKSWNGDDAMSDIVKQLSFGVRALNTPGHQREIDWIKAQLEAASVPVVIQDGLLSSGSGGKNLAVTNIIGRFDPLKRNRIIVGTHYDSIIRAYADPRNPDGPMPGANNSASGVALILETMRVLRGLGHHPELGIDFVFFDGEEGPLALGAGDPNWWALGSAYFSTRLQDVYRDKKPVGSVIFDMVCYNKLVLHPEPSSLKFAEKGVVKFWRIGHELAPQIFVPSIAPAPISDDHTALAAAGIPSFLVIGFDYDPWFNTTQDTPDKCSAASLEAVGRTLLRYLFSAPGG